jgi:hypothetical protein
MLFLDTEFNGFGGQLISIGICSDLSNHELYLVRDLPSNIHPWVKEHVVPWILAPSIADDEFRMRLYYYLKKHENETIVADWPEDLSHLLQCLCQPNGVSYNLQLDLRLIQSGELKSMIPHNAISDARALMHWYTNNKNNQE